MSMESLTKVLQEIQELRAMQADLEAEITALQDAVKQHMAAIDADTLQAGPFKVTWKAVTSTRIDTAALRKDLPEVWQEYGKTTTTRRFNVA